MNKSLLLFASLSLSSMVGCNPYQKATSPLRALPEQLDWLPSAAVDRYEDTLPESSQLSSDALARFALTQLPEEQRSFFSHSHKLDLIAGVEAQAYLERGQRLEPALREALQWRYGSYELSPNRWVMTVNRSYRNTIALPNSELELEAPLVEKLVKELREKAAHGVPHRFGIAYLQSYGHRGDRSAICLVTAEHPVTITGLPRRVAAGESVELTGTLAEGFQRPVLYHNGEAGRAERTRLEVDGSRRFQTNFTAPSTPGEHLLELRAVNARGWSVLVARLPFYVDQEPPQGSPGPLPPALTESRNLEELPALVLQRLNERRARAGQAPLQYSPEASEIAASFATRSAHYQELFSNELRQALAAQGLHFGEIYSSKRRFHHLSEWLQRSARSPSARHQHLSPKYTHFAVAYHRLGPPNNRILQLFVLLEGESAPQAESTPQAGESPAAGERSRASAPGAAGELPSAPRTP